LTGFAGQSKILVTGGGGQLAQELVRIEPTIDAPPKERLDFSRPGAIEAYAGENRYNLIIHAGAVTNRFEDDPDEEYIRSNIIGTAHVVLYAMRQGARLVYISTDYVYPSERGGYTEESVLLPVNRYAKSKLGGELAVQLYDNSLIIRTSFYNRLDFPKGCTDQYTSRLPLHEAAAAIYTLSRMNNLRGIINLGTPAKRSLYEIIRAEFNPSVVPVTRSQISISYTIPPDSSMDTSMSERLLHPSGDSAKDLRQCRVCRSEDLYTYLHLGRTPLANSYVQKDQLSEPEFKEELAIQLCSTCGLSQLTKVVNPDLMFKHYLYVSSTTQTIRDHWAELARTTAKRASAQPGDLVLDVASNDGCLLSKFRDLGMRVVGVDPAENLAAEANASGIPTLCKYWSSHIARDVVSRFGAPRIITATNVFAHVDDVHEFVNAVSLALAPKGVFVIEAPYLRDFIIKREFDTAYHEHLSYLAMHPLVMLMSMHGLQVFDAEYFTDIHGGTMRVYVCRGKDYPVSERVTSILDEEVRFGIKDRAPYDAFARSVTENKQVLRALVADLTAQGKTIWAYGASAKGNTLMNFFELTKKEIPVAIDDNPKKWGYYAPGSHMLIKGIDELARAPVDYLLLLAWNFEKEIIRRCKEAKYAGKFIRPVPEAVIREK
jgi:dTDP-4-dehydrorhamnose reductase/SAM-dependent methyltransferase